VRGKALLDYPTLAGHSFFEHPLRKSKEYYDGMRNRHGLFYFLLICAISTPGIASATPKQNTTEGSVCAPKSTTVNGVTVSGTKSKLYCINLGTSIGWQYSRYQNLTPPDSFTNLQSHLNGIAFGAWLKASMQIQGATSVLGNVKTIVGPNTSEDLKDVSVPFNLVSRLYSNFPQVKNLYEIKFSQSDSSWAQQQYDSIHPNNYDANAAANVCAGSFGCTGEYAGIDAQNDGVILAGEGGNYSNQFTVNGKSRSTSGQLSAHEYTHTIQILNAPCDNGQGCYGNLPDWLLEGNAEWSSAAAVYNSKYQDYLIFRVGDLYINPSKFSAAWMTNYLNPNPLFVDGKDNWAQWENSGWIKYVAGFMVNEILVDVKGPDSVMKMYQDVGNGSSFVQAFQTEFGMPWSQACPLIASAVSAELKNGINLNKYK
jgi:hypothetical protein